MPLNVTVTFTFTAATNAAFTHLEEEEENLFAKKAGCQKGLQPINAGYSKHKHYMLKQLHQCQVSKH